MSTVRQVVDAVFRDWLRPGDDQPVVTRLTGDLTATATSVPIDTAMLLPDELDLFVAGGLVEVGREQMLVRDVSGSNLVVMRGSNGTTAVAHSSDDLVYPQPRYGRQAVFEAVCDAVPALWPDLYQVVSRDVSIGSAYTEVPSWAQTVIDVRWAEGTDWYTTSGIISRGFSASSTKAALFADGIPVGRAATVTFRGSFERPTAEGDDLELYGVRREWERIVAITAAAEVISGGPELDPITHEFVAEQMARETLPAGAAGQLAKRLLDRAEVLRRQARRALDAHYPIPVRFMPGSGQV